MRRILLTTLALFLAFNAMAQQGPRQDKSPRHKESPKIEELVPDLTAAQKNKIDAITRRSTKIIEDYRNQLHAVRDSIRSYMNSRDDHSNVLFPLYDREGRLQSEISKEYYRTKVAIDKVLTPEQFQQMHQKMDKNRPAKKSASKEVKPKPASKK